MKVKYSTFQLTKYHHFGKHKPIFKILAPTDSRGNMQCKSIKDHVLYFCDMCLYSFCVSYVLLCFFLYMYLFL